METPDPPNDTPGALKQVVLTPHDIPCLRVYRDFLPYLLESFSQFRSSDNNLI